jgi:hypothetical protein
MLNTIILCLSFAAPGDVEVVLATPLANLDAAAKTTLVTAITAAFPTASAAAIQNYGCQRDVDNADEAKRDDLICGGFYEKRITETQYIDLAIAERVVKTFDTAPEGFVDAWLKPPPEPPLDNGKRVASGTDTWTKHNAFVAQVFIGLGAGDTMDFACSRAEEDPSRVICRCAYYDTVNETTAITLKHAKMLHKVIRRVP